MSRTRLALMKEAKELV